MGVTSLFRYPHSSSGKYDFNNSHCVFIHSVAEPVDAKEPTTCSIRKSCSDTHWDKKRACSLFTEHLTLLSVLWHHRNSPLFKDQLEAWSQHGLPSALRWSMPPQNAGHCSTSLLTIVPPHSISIPGGRDSSYNQVLGLQVQRCICALPTDTLSCHSCCSFPPTGNPMWWEKSCRVCEHPYM